MLYIVAKLKSFSLKDFFFLKATFSESGRKCWIFNSKKRLLRYPNGYQISDVTFCPDIRHPVILRSDAFLQIILYLIIRKKVIIITLKKFYSTPSNIYNSKWWNLHKNVNKKIASIFTLHNVNDTLRYFVFRLEMHHSCSVVIQRLTCRELFDW